MDPEEKVHTHAQLCSINPGVHLHDIQTCQAGYAYEFISYDHIKHIFSPAQLRDSCLLGACVTRVREEPGETPGSPPMSSTDILSHSTCEDHDR